MPRVRLLQADQSAQRWWLLAGATCASWWLFATQLIPPVIRSAYYGHSFAVLNNIFQGRADHGVHYYLGVWEEAAVPGLLACAAFWALLYALSRPAFFRRCVGESTPGALGAIRMLTCGILLLSVVWEDFAGLAVLPPELRRSMGVVDFLHRIPGFEAWIRDPGALRAFQGTTAVLLALGMIGWQTRLTVPLGALCFLVFAGLLRQYSFFWHQHLVALYVLSVLALTPCGDGWSLDRLLRTARGKPVVPRRPSALYGWCRYAVWIAVALPYVAAGCSKLRNAGWMWWHANNMRRILYTDTLNPMQFDWTVSLSLAKAPDLAFALLGIAGVFGEALFGLVLVSRIARKFFPALMFGMHLGIIFLQNILFLDLIILQAVFYDWTKARLAISRRLAEARGRIEVLYDGDCPLCRRTVRLLDGWDLFQRLELLDFRRMDLADYNARRGLRLTPDALEEEMAVVCRGRAALGFEGYRVLAWALPLWWPAAPLLSLPGAGWAGSRIYRAIARRRLSLLRCGEQCAIEPQETPRAAIGLRPVAGVTCLILLLGFCWLYRIEFFPFTAMQMYSGSKWRGTTPIIYYRAYAVRASGHRSKGAFNKAVGVMAINSRYRPVMWKCFGSPDNVEICRSFLRASGEAYNRRTPADQRIVQFEIQQWNWDYVQYPGDLSRAVLASQIVVDMPRVEESPRVARQDRNAATP